MDAEEWWSKQSPAWRAEFDKAMKKAHKEFEHSLIFGTAGEPGADRDLEKIFNNPEAYKVKGRDDVFDTDLLQKRWDELDAIERQCPYDMLEEDYYQHLIDMEHLHCGPHSDDSPEGKWMKHYLTKKVLARR